MLASDDAFVVTEVDDAARYVRAYARRITSDADEVEFLVRADDRVVLFKSTARRNGSVSDFGANRKRIDDIRRRGAVFGLMGDGLTADSYNGGDGAEQRSAGSAEGVLRIAERAGIREAVRGGGRVIILWHIVLYGSLCFLSKMGP